MAVIDTSGSITDDLLELISAELRRLSRTNSVTVVECDVTVHRVYKYQPLESVAGRSYLEDLYLGLLARDQGFRVVRVSDVVGYEEPRQGWASLLVQRLRWMNGLSMGFSVILLSLIQPWAAFVFFVALAILLGLASRRGPVTTCCYLVAFPVLHLLASFLFWLPLPQALLRRR